jgi:hypothetical protein
MCRFLLDELTQLKVSQDLPEISSLTGTIAKLRPDFISINIHPESNIPVAVVCLRDAVEALADARYALGECYEHIIWYREKIQPPNEEGAVVFGRFYADDIAFRLYSAGEHLANAIICMLEVDDQQLDPYRTGRTSQQAIVGNYLVREQPNNPVTVAVLKLVQSKEWQRAIEYRSKLVHDQPPTVKGLGEVYKRARRWQKTKSGYGLGIGQGDAAEHSLEEILGFIKPALFLFIDALASITALYIESLKSKGITLSGDSLEIKVV